MGGQGFDWAGISQSLGRAGNVYMGAREQREQKSEIEKQRQLAIRREAARRRSEISQRALQQSPDDPALRKAAEDAAREEEAVESEAAKVPVKLYPTRPAAAPKKTPTKLQPVTGQTGAPAGVATGPEPQPLNEPSVSAAPPAGPTEPGPTGPKGIEAPAPAAPGAYTPPTPPQAQAPAGERIEFGLPPSPAVQRRIDFMRQDLATGRQVIDQYAKGPNADPDRYKAAVVRYNQRAAALRGHAVQSLGYSSEEALAAFPDYDPLEVEMESSNINAARAQAEVARYKNVIASLDAEVERHGKNRSQAGRAAMQAAMLKRNEVYDTLRALVDPSTVGVPNNYNVAAELENWDKGREISPKVAFESERAKLQMQALEQFSRGVRTPEVLALIGLPTGQRNGKVGVEWKGALLTEQWQLKWAYHNDPEFRQAFPNARAFFAGADSADDKTQARWIKQHLIIRQGEADAAEAQYQNILKAWNAKPETLQRAVTTGVDPTRRMFGIGGYSEEDLKGATKIWEALQKAEAARDAAKAKLDSFRKLSENPEPPQKDEAQLPLQGPVMVDGINIHESVKLLRDGKIKPPTVEQWNRMTPAQQKALEMNGVPNPAVKKVNLDPRLQSLASQGALDGVAFRVTSTTGDRHVVGSEHYQGKAMDIALPPNAPPSVWNRLLAALRAAGYNVLDERIRPRTAAGKNWTGPHFHVEVG